MRFLIVLIIFKVSAANAAVQDFNSLVKEASIQQQIIHKKLLQSIAPKKVSVASADAGRVGAPEGAQTEAAPNFTQGEESQNEDFETRLVKARG